MISVLRPTRLLGSCLINPKFPSNPNEIKRWDLKRHFITLRSVVYNIKSIIRICEDTNLSLDVT